MNSGDFTLLLGRVERGEAQAADELLPLVYGELRKLAAARMAHESADQTLQPTAERWWAYARAWLSVEPRQPGK